MFICLTPVVASIFSTIRLSRQLLDWWYSAGAHEDVPKAWYVFNAQSSASVNFAANLTYSLVIPALQSTFL